MKQDLEMADEPRLPQKRYFRQRAHVNVFNDMKFDYPERPSTQDWAPYYPAYFRARVDEGEDGKRPLSDGAVVEAKRGPGCEAPEAQEAQEASKEEATNLARVEFADIGCGYGGLLVALSPLYPNTLMVGMEIRTKLVRYLQKRIEALRAFQHGLLDQRSSRSVEWVDVRSKLDLEITALHTSSEAVDEPDNGETTRLVPGHYENIASMRINCQKYLPNFFAKSQLSKIFVLFADPHFKRRKHKARIVTQTLLAEYAYVLKEGGIFYMITDVRDLYEWNVKHLDAFPLFERLTQEEVDKDPAVPCVQSETSAVRRTSKQKQTKPAKQTEVDDIVDSLLNGDFPQPKKSKKAKKSKPTDVDDIVDALLGGELEGKSKPKKRKSRAATPPSDSDSASDANSDSNDSDDVADLYAWDEPAEESTPAKSEEMSCEHLRMMELARAAAAASSEPTLRDASACFAEMNQSHTQLVDEDHEMQTQKVRELPREKLESMGRYVAIDCEMVGAGFKGCRSLLARVSVVNYHGHVLLDAYVKPTEPVTDYRTWVSGIRKSDLDGGRDFESVQREVAELLEGRVLVGHALKNDLNALMLTHPPLDVRDTLKYPGFRSKGSKTAPALRKLAANILQLRIQDGEHSPIVDAKTAMLLYRQVKPEWEAMLAPRKYKARVVKTKTKERFAKLRQEISDQQQQQNANIS
ncbi:tRNA (guanine-N(7)-)-methyltransferase (tRNA(m7G46)-methyltransferase) [Coemansia sp. RSA 678]|nr:tRNA (guanine-N(7)-)-methyltransferase (tRNA(m7G46)-methyltransferase) [Coemansia sp. RSA 678]